MTKKIPLLLTLVVLLTAVPLGVAAAAPASATPTAGATTNARCGAKRTNPNCAPSATATPTATPTSVPAATNTPRPTSTPTSVPAATNTPRPTSTPTSVPAATNTPRPTNTPTGSPPVAGQPCPPALHDSYVTTGPDGKTYPTWHPAVDPQSGCYFGHEHGVAPRTSLVNSSLPAFGYVGQLAASDEPHAGFKVFVQNHGAVNNDGRTISHDVRMVFHMGTGGVKRFDTRLHSLEYDFSEVGGSGHAMHVKGMADTGGVGSICSNPRQGKTVVTQPGTGCSVDSLYEIWAVVLNVGGRGQVNASFALFDPITVMNPSDHTRLLFTSDYYP